LNSSHQFGSLELSIWDNEAQNAITNRH
jgi:hypothetical protein